MGSEQPFHKLSVNWRDDCIVIEEVKVLAILVDDDYSEWAQLVVLGIGHHVVGVARSQCIGQYGPVLFRSGGVGHIDAHGIVNTDTLRRFFRHNRGLLCQ